MQKCIVIEKAIRSIRNIILFTVASCSIVLSMDKDEKHMEMNNNTFKDKNIYDEGVSKEIISLIGDFTDFDKMTIPLKGCTIILHPKEYNKIPERGIQNLSKKTFFDILQLLDVQSMVNFAKTNIRHYGWFVSHIKKQGEDLIQKHSEEAFKTYQSTLCTSSPLPSVFGGLLDCFINTVGKENLVDFFSISSNENPACSKVKCNTI